MTGAFCAGSMDSRILSHTSIDGSTLRFSEGAVLDDGSVVTNSGDFIDPQPTRKSSNCNSYFSYLAPVGKLYFFYFIFLPFWHFLFFYSNLEA